VVRISPDAIFTHDPEAPEIGASNNAHGLWFPNPDVLNREPNHFGCPVFIQLISFRCHWWYLSHKSEGGGNTFLAWDHPEIGVTRSQHSP
jgi:hypothetical protein